MRTLAVVLLLAGVALARPAPPAWADDAPSAVSEPDQAAIRGVIDGQMRAFRADDGPAAFAFASPGIQLQFGDSTNFMDMVRRGYPPVYRPQSYAFGALTEMGGRTVQKVVLTGPDGRRTLALYYMEHEPDGSWRIGGCMLTESDDVGV